MGIQAEKFKEDLYNCINNSQLPMALAFYIFKDCYNSLYLSYQEALKTEQEYNNKPLEEKLVSVEINPQDLLPKDIEEDDGIVTVMVDN